MDSITFRFVRGLIYIPVCLFYQQQSVLLENCIFDTGSGSSVFDTDLLKNIGLTYHPDSRIKRLATVGGYQRVFTRWVDALVLRNEKIPNVEIEIGDLHSQFKIDGIIGNDIIQKFDWELKFSLNELVLHSNI